MNRNNFHTSINPNIKNEEDERNWKLLSWYFECSTFEKDLLRDLRIGNSEKTTAINSRKVKRGKNGK